MTSPAATAMPICNQWWFTQAMLLSHQARRSASGVGARALSEVAAVRSEWVTAILWVRRSRAVSPRRASASDRPKSRARNAKHIDAWEWLYARPWLPPPNQLPWAGRDHGAAGRTG